MNKLYFLQLLILPLLIIKSAIVIPTFLAVAEPADNNDEMIPKQIVERLLRLNRIDYYRGGRSQLLLGKLPDKLPVEIPQPSNTQILASIQRGESYYEMVLNVPQGSAQVESFYENQLTQKGWKQHRSTSPKQAFATSATQKDDLNFCKSEKGPALRLNLNQPAQDTPTEVSISLDANESNSFCRFLSGGLPFAFAKTPTLKPPANTKVIPKPIGGYSSEMSHSKATLESDELNLEQLNQHYISQMQQAGWTKMADTKNNQTTFSLWTLKDKDNNIWQGMMSIKPIPNKSGQYLSNLIVMQEKF
ncbi:MAG: hypothetical protein AAF378_00265 [Cyanobacteria bacterium P01_A01_bin.84]